MKLRYRVEYVVLENGQFSPVFQLSGDSEEYVEGAFAAYSALDEHRVITRRYWEVIP